MRHTNIKICTLSKLPNKGERTTGLFYESSFCWSVPVWFWNSKTCCRIDKSQICFGFCPKELNFYSLELKVQEFKSVFLNSFDIASTATIKYACNTSIVTKYSIICQISYMLYIMCVIWVHNDMLVLLIKWFSFVIYHI